MPTDLTDTLVLGGSWQTYAACRNFQLPKYGSWWFPDHPQTMPDEARKVCAECLVQTQCKKWIMRREQDTAISTRGVNGNLAGMTPKERYQLAKLQQQETCGESA